ncbi:hypothetical protein GCM10025857_15920 [Alicyclobacillus contaminans]|uniref:hypothetical protein n=1 Tax=Alicyclobacillus contaminans TaxID=392016 RepID=UPI00041B8C4C|nr:hypothetical protein [Alicyclobacillus contaminans]GMA50235.1 hypothetical protein GCM10025857_15920 [Alicyclobacillus contaminans]
MDDLQYPIGKFNPGTITPELRQQWMSEISELPKRLASTVAHLTQDQLDTPYRPGGW